MVVVAARSEVGRRGKRLEWESRAPELLGRSLCVEASSSGSQ